MGNQIKFQELYYHVATDYALGVDRNFGITFRWEQCYDFGILFRFKTKKQLGTDSNVMAILRWGDQAIMRILCQKWRSITIGKSKSAMLQKKRSEFNQDLIQISVEQVRFKPKTLPLLSAQEITVILDNCQKQSDQTPRTEQVGFGPTRLRVKKLLYRLNCVS